MLSRFMSKVLVPKNPNDCWEWTGTKNKGYAYGRFSVGHRMELAHRVAFTLFHLEDPGKEVMHTCDNPSCVNPAHLRSGDHTENMRDCAAKGRTFSQRKTHCKHGHEMVPENTYKQVVRGVNRGRGCRKCREVSLRKYRAGKK